MARIDRKPLYATKKLRDVRNERGMTQKEMAYVLSLMLERSVSFSTYQKWEQATISVTLTDALKISRGLEISMKELWRAR